MRNGLVTLVISNKFILGCFALGSADLPSANQIFVEWCGERSTFENLNSSRRSAVLEKAFPRRKMSGDVQPRKRKEKRRKKGKNECN